MRSTVDLLDSTGLKRHATNTFHETALFIALCGFNGALSIETLVQWLSELVTKLGMGRCVERLFSVIVNRVN